MPELAYHPVVRSIATALRERCGLKKHLPGVRLVVGVSGGADSVALLRALHHLMSRRKWGLQLTVCHVHHHLRGEDADADAAFVKALADQLSVPLIHKDICPRPTAKEKDGTGENLEAVAREMRYGALAEAATQAQADYVVVAHHADDQLETVLMRLLRGASVAGLRGMSWARPLSDKPVLRELRLIRPMLSVPRSSVLSYLNVLGQAWREDVTNADLDRTRARLRAEVLPVMRALQPNYAERVTELSEHMQALHGMLVGQTQHAMQGEDVRREPRRMQWSRAMLGAKPLVVVQECLAQAARALALDPEQLSASKLRSAARACCDRTGGTRTFELGDGYTLTLTRESVTITAPPDPSGLFSG